MTVRNLSLIKGQTVSFEGVLKDDSGQRIDLTNLALTWKVGDKDFLRTQFTLSEGNGITITDAARGEWRIDLRKSDTEDLSQGLYVHQGFAANGDAENYTFTRGRLTLRGIVQ